MSRWIGFFDFEILSAPDSGERTLIWSATCPNNLADQGEHNVLDTYLRGLNTPTTFFLRLFNDIPQDTDSLSSLSGEPGFAQGYAPQQLLRSNSDWALGFVGGDAQAASKQVTFHAWSPVTLTHAVLATASDNNGLLISYASLSGTRTLISGEFLRVSYRPSLQ